MPSMPFCSKPRKESAMFSYPYGYSSILSPPTSLRASGLRPGEPKNERREGCRAEVAKRRRRTNKEFRPMETPVGHDLNADQIAYWNGPGGQRWADRQQSQDVLLPPVAYRLIDPA